MRFLTEPSPQARVTTPAQVTIGATAAVVLAANPKRKGFIIQNTGTTVLKLTFGATVPTQTVYHVALKGCTLANDGTGGGYVEDRLVLAVNAISSAAGGTFVLMETMTGAPDWNLAASWEEA